MIPAPVQTAACDWHAPGWPLITRLDFHALRSAVACARGHVRLVAFEWDLSGLADTAELLASELVTNAVRASEHLKKESRSSGSTCGAAVDAFRSGIAGYLRVGRP